MKTTKIDKPDIVHKAAVNAVIELIQNKYEVNSLGEIFAFPLLFLGEKTQEKIDDINNLQEILKKQRNFLKNNAEGKLLKCHSIFYSLSPTEDSAVYVDEFFSEPEKQENQHQKCHFRISITLFKYTEGWKVASLQISNLNLEEDSFLLQKNLEGNKVKSQTEASEKVAVIQNYSEKLAAIQAQLLKQEKLASLGQLTAGIAHEIKNPLNFINNFSELSSEFLEEIEENLQKLEPNEITEEIQFLLNDVKANLEKIHQHGTRADGIVKSMLLHSRGGSGKMEETDLNALIKEYVNLSFHGMRANKNPINVDIKIETDEHLGLISINPENFSRVILNLCKNAFDAMREKLEVTGKSDYLPKLIVRTKGVGNKVLIDIEDNGPGISEEVKEKMMLPFFTTKKGSDGTGLGLSISQDIIKDHDGALEIDTKEGIFTRFTIVLNRRN